MSLITRRTLLAGGVASVVDAGTAHEQISDVLRLGMANGNIPAVVGTIADRRRTLYAGAFGARNHSGVSLRVDDIFQIASMTKLVTTVAALQLVEQKKIILAEPVARHLPELANPGVLEGFDPSGKPVLRPARTPITLHHLLTHTSGMCYPIWDQQMLRYVSANVDDASAKSDPLMFEPGMRWQYGEGPFWAGRLVEAITRANLEDYFQETILRPLSMQDTSYIVPETRLDRQVAVLLRGSDGKLKPSDQPLPTRPSTFRGDGGLYSTAADYVRFMQMILNRGMGPDGTRILQRQTVESMLRNHIGDLNAGKMRSFQPEMSADVDLQPGQPQKWGFGLLINTTRYAGGRSAGSGAWAGALNTFFWIDPKRDRCAVLLMQYLPFADQRAVVILKNFETAAYRHL